MGERFMTFGRGGNSLAENGFATTPNDFTGPIPPPRPPGDDGHSGLKSAGVRCVTPFSNSLMIWLALTVLLLTACSQVKPGVYAVLRPTIIDVRGDCHQDVEGPPDVLGYFVWGGSIGVDYICTEGWNETLQHELEHQRDQLTGKPATHVRKLKTDRL